ncbi:type II toxin-antitoxin system RelE/ParE family toxin [Candidatus Sumerlaeota bacterium]|nr:type II toxin-antitoxin system RelE/ParE family toxin [Candidatus Sumerlaeota bacterium]
MAEIRWTQEAAAWLEDIYKYISQDSPRAAARVAQGIYDRVQILSEFPEIGHRYRRTAEGDIRVLLYGHYRIAYLVGQREVVEILGIFHGALEIERYL